MGGVEEDEWAEEELHLCRAEEEREAAKEREIREKKLMEESIALRREDLRRHQLFLREDHLRLQHDLSSERSLDFSPLKEEAVSPAPSCESMKSDRSMGLPVSFKRDHLLRLHPNYFSPREQLLRLHPNYISSRAKEELHLCRAVEEREAAAAKRREIMEIQDRLLFGVPTSIISLSERSLDFSPLKEEAVSPAPSCESMKSDRSMGLPVSFKRYKFSPEEERAGSPASSCVSMKSARSMGLPVSFKRPASCESVKSDQSMGPPIAFKREDFWSHERGPFIFCGQKAGSPAPSCLSMKSDMSRESPPYFSGEPLPSDTKDPGINAGHWRELNSMVSHVQNELDKLKRFVRAINPEGQGEYEEGVKCEGGSAEKRQQKGISEDHTGLPEKN